MKHPGAGMVGSCAKAGIDSVHNRESAASDTRYRLSNLREREGRREVDPIAELGRAGRRRADQGRCRGVERLRCAPLLRRDPSVGMLRSQAWPARKAGRGLAGTTTLSN